ncbi:EVE domain-containing protein [Patescibacteria group bacterium]|nr:EVE domain-containing protein [Patescibacteria group bacterium]
MGEKTVKRGYWLFKSEPEVFGIDHLKQKKIATWDGVRNYQVRNLLRDEVRVGDRALFYHSSTKDVGVVGEMEVVGGAFPDPLQFDSSSEYFDTGSTKAAPRWVAVKVEYVRTFSRLVSLAELRGDPVLNGMRILERGNRLSITRVSEREYERIVQIGGVEK